MLRPQMLEALLLAGSVFIGMTAPAVHQLVHRRQAWSIADSVSAVRFQLISNAGLEKCATRATIWLADRAAHVHLGLARKGGSPGR